MSLDFSIDLILCSVFFTVCVCVVLCAVFRLIVVLFCVMCVICLLCLIAQPLPPGKNTFEVKINNNNNNNPSSRTMDLGSTQPLTAMSTRNLPGG
jgi:ABC-type bacteriocin/lantibiotic exporter with double-glycine peptidase domain